MVSGPYKHDALFSDVNYAVFYCRKKCNFSGILKKIYFQDIYRKFLKKGNYLFSPASVSGIPGSRPVAIASRFAVKRTFWASCPSIESGRCQIIFLHQRSVSSPASMQEKNSDTDSVPVHKNECNYTEPCQCNQGTESGRRSGRRGCNGGCRSCGFMWLPDSD